MEFNVIYVNLQIKRWDLLFAVIILDRFAIKLSLLPSSYRARTTREEAKKKQRLFDVYVIVVLLFRFRKTETSK